MPQSSSQKYILVVDDDPTMQLVLQSMIEKAGFRPVIAENGDKALQFVEIGGDNISVVLLDQNMPDMDGLEVVKKLDEMTQNRGIPIIMQSGSTDPDDIKAAINAGVFYYLSKPFKMEALQNVLNFAIEQEELRSVLEDRVSRGYVPLNLILSASFEFRTIREAKKMAILLSSFFPDPFRVFPGMISLLLNAVEHGRLGIGDEGKRTLIEAEDFAETAKSFSSKSENIEVQFVHKEGRFSVRITDAGDGFDWEKACAFDNKKDSYAHGYGVLKALSAFDHVKYNTAGNQVMASVFEI